MTLCMSNKTNFGNCFPKMFILKAIIIKGNILIKGDEFISRKNFQGNMNINSDVYVEQGIIHYP